MKAVVCLWLVLAGPLAFGQGNGGKDAPTPPELAKLADEFRAWRRGEGGGAPDYAARAADRRQQLPDWRRRFDALKRDDWPIPVKVDYLALQSELNELDFETNVTREPSRNPDFYIDEAVRGVTRNVGGRYQSGVGVTVPYDGKRAAAITAALKRTGQIVAQAQKNLTEAVPEMADMAIERLENVAANYAEFGQVVGQHVPDGERAALTAAAAEAGAALAGYREWLQANRPKFTASYLWGKANFEWYVKRVLMMPYDSAQLLTQAEMERDRGFTFLQYERQKNRFLPKLDVVKDAAKDNHEYSEWKEATDVLARHWAEDYELFTRPDYVGPMRDEDGGIWIEPFGMLGFPTKPKPANGKTEFLTPPDHWFSKIYWELGHRIDPATNHAHSDYPGHSFERAVSQKTSRPIRREHNTRGDAWTYYMEEVQLQTNYPFLRGPRIREWMYGLHIMRAERVYAAVKFADGSLKPADVATYMMKSTPWMEPYVARKHELWRKFTDPAQVLTYQVARSQVYKLLGERMRQLGDQFDLRAFHDQLLATGQIPVSLAHLEIAGRNDEIAYLWKHEPLPTQPGAAAGAKTKKR